MDLEEHLKRSLYFVPFHGDSCKKVKMSKLSLIEMTSMIEIVEKSYDHMKVGLLCSYFRSSG